MAEVLAGAVPAEAASGRREVSRRRAVRRFKWMILAPLLLMLFSLLTPVLMLQLYFSFHQWTVYLSSWWNADFVGFDIFAERVHRSAVRLGGAALAGLRRRIDDRLLRARVSARLSDLSAVPRAGVVLRAVHPADADRADRDRLHGADAARPQRPAQRHVVEAERPERSGLVAVQSGYRAADRDACSTSGIGRRSRSSSCSPACRRCRRSRSRRRKSSAHRPGASSGKCSCRCCGR